MTQPKTAILIFANSAKREGSLKSFRKSTSLFRELNKYTLQKVKETGLPYFLSSEREQRGATFAQRYCNAIQQVFDHGFENIITIGNDTPHLQTEQLLRTATLLKNKEVVLGPSFDGGYYLLGINKSHFVKDKFLKLSWQTNRLTSEISQLLGAASEIVFLKTLSDIDGASDVAKVLNVASRLSEAIIAILKRILLPKKNNINTTFYLASQLFQTAFLNKGSPLNAALGFSN